MVGLTLEHVEIEGGCLVHGEALESVVLKAYDVCGDMKGILYLEGLRDIEKLVFERVSGPLFTVEIGSCACVIEDTVWTLGYK